jgi:hypothetical protein
MGEEEMEQRARRIASLHEVQGNVKPHGAGLAPTKAASRLLARAI